MPRIAFCSAAPTLGGRSAHIPPVAAAGDLKAMLVGEVFTVGAYCLGVLFIPDVADALEEQQGQDITLPVRAVNRAAAQDISGLPQVGFQLGKREWLFEQRCLCHETVTDRADRGRAIRRQEDRPRLLTGAALSTLRLPVGTPLVLLRPEPSTGWGALRLSTEFDCLRRL
jgi:hypothetical protein